MSQNSEPRLRSHAEADNGGGYITLHQEGRLPKLPSHDAMRHSIIGHQGLVEIAPQESSRSSYPRIPLADPELQADWEGLLAEREAAARSTRGV